MKKLILGVLVVFSLLVKTQTNCIGFGIGFGGGDDGGSSFSFGVGQPSYGGYYDDYDDDYYDDYDDSYYYGYGPYNW